MIWPCCRDLGFSGVLAVRQAEMVTNRGFCRFNFGPDER
jgi:hypothetical protein